MNRVSTTKGKRTTLRQVGEAEVVSPSEKTHPSFSNPQTGKTTKAWLFPLGGEDSSSTSGTPTPRSCTRERSPQQLALKTNAEYAQENYRTAGKGKPALKGLSTDSYHPKTNMRTPG